MARCVLQVLLIWGGQLPHGNQAHWGMDSTRQLMFGSPSHHCEPSICPSTPLTSSTMPVSLLRRGSTTTGSYCAARVERLSASSISHRAFVSFASTLLRRSWRSISLPFLGKEACRRGWTIRRGFVDGTSVAQGDSVSTGLSDGCRPVALTSLWVKPGRCGVNLVAPGGCGTSPCI
jgi:hypothetical protein